MDLSYIWFSSEGRIGRRDYWLKGAGPVLALAVVIGVIREVVNAYSDALGDLITIFPLMFLGYVLWRVSTKRWHDLGKSGWWFLLQLIPFLGIVVTVGLGIPKGQEGKNQYERM